LNFKLYADIRYIQYVFIAGVLNIFVQSGMTALMLVSNENYVDVAKLLLKHGASVQATDEVCTCMCLCEVFVM